MLVPQRQHCEGVANHTVDGVQYSASPANGISLSCSVFVLVTSRNSYLFLRTTFYLQAVNPEMAQPQVPPSSMSGDAIAQFRRQTQSLSHNLLSPPPLRTAFFAPVRSQNAKPRWRTIKTGFTCTVRVPLAMLKQGSTYRVAFDRIAERTISRGPNWFERTKAHCTRDYRYSGAQRREVPQEMH